MEINSEKLTEPIETSRVGDKLYNVDLLVKYADKLPIEIVPTDSLKDAVGEGYKYWLDKDNEMFGPSAILKDWEDAKNNPLWIDHIKSIENANLDNPIWLSPDGFVFDGMHRLTRAFID